MNHFSKVFSAMAFLGLCSLGGNAHADTVVADSIAGFSGTQGSNNWYYGYESGSISSFSASSFQEMGYFDTSAQVWQISSSPAFPPWTTIWADGGHPNGDNSFGSAQLSIRRWVSDVSGVVTLTGVLLDENVNSGNGATGVTGGIYANGAQIWSGTIGNGGQTSFSFSTLVATGTKIDFVLDPNGNDYYDSTRFSAQITAAVPEPETYALLLAGLGLMGAMARRRKLG